MFHVVLYEPEIPPNTGNIIRLCANTGTCLHLIHPLGFRLDDAKLRRAGLDYREWADVQEYGDLDEFLERIRPERLFALSTKGRRCYADADFRPNDALLFGPETRGLPESLLASLPESHRLYVPMKPESRSLNLSNTVALVLYEAWRQNRFSGAVRFG
ncbi:tRNA (uridine(34)/cytosine(34)/5-carboxymethylaminomethyluridine(34)-2'-O)-methyltransferase TrmL [Methylocaldum szegediense]|uniref:tRNA (cytidine(34)-2'-O)-methyltransferase n=1 Tax=Methylocaldum szegediense TaxID=73780 RepID=A0ABM9I7G6_9GAMM|nr:tRNA (uridine(34)/cytosine(34)/5-carboxymethylaminomethyluridine(34)-2'-O)-methyltransferase TrmL [Methylocaldum szegediense]CAI8941873.1 tRNA (cytidine/uridine-2'-O)-ribose methyltransferase [Methylocaldum szegediense]